MSGAPQHVIRGGGTHLDVGLRQMERQVVSKQRVVDHGEDVFMPTPVSEYPAIHFLQIGESKE